MADDFLTIGSSFDIGPITDGMEEAASAVEAGASAMEASFQAAGQGAANLLDQLGAVEGVAVNVASSLTTLETEATQASEAIGNSASQFQISEEAAAQLEAGIDNLLAQFSAVGGQVQVAASQMNLFGDAVASVISPQEEAAAAMLEMEEQVAALQSQLIAMQPVVSDVAQQYNLFADAASEAAVTIAPVNEAVADASGQYELFTQAVADATGQLNLFETEVDSIVSGNQALMTGLQADANLVNQVRDTLESLGETSTAVASAFQFLSDTSAVASSTAQEHAAAVEVVNGALGKLNLQLQGTAGSLKLVTTGDTEAGVATRELGAIASDTTGRITGLNSALGYFSGRAIAYEAGVSQLGFALGTLGRTLAPLNQLLIAAFPVVAPILLIEAISSVIDKLQKMEDQVRRNGAAMVDFAASADHAADSLELENLKLEDQINKFEGRPTENRLAEAALETKMQVDQLLKSLDDASEKAVDLFEKAQTGLVQFALTGAAPSTTGIEAIDRYLGLRVEKIKDLQREYALATENMRTAQKSLEDNDNEATQAARDNAQARLVAVRNSLRDELDARLGEIQDSRAAEIKRVQEGRTGPFEPKTVGEAEAAYAGQEKSVRALINALDAEESAQKRILQTIKDKQGVAEEANAAESRQRTRIEEEPTIKADEGEARQQAAIAREAAQLSLSETEAGLKLEAETQQEYGQKKEVAELAIYDRLIVARKKYTQELLDAQEKEYTQLRDSLIKQRDLDEQTKVGPERVAALEADNAAIQRLDEENVAKRMEIQKQGAIAITNIETQEAKARVDAEKRYGSEVVAARREEVSQIISTQRLETDETVNQRKNSASEELRTIKDLQSEHTLTIEQARDARLQILAQEQKDIDSMLEAEKKSLEAQADAIMSQMAMLALNETALKGLGKSYDEIVAAINRVTAAQKKANDEIGKAGQNVQTDYAKELLQEYQTAFGAIGNAFGNTFAQMIETGKSFSQIMGQEVLKLEAEIAQSIIRSLTRWVAYEVAKMTSHTISEQAQTTATAVGESTRTSFGSVSTAAHIARSIARMIAHGFSELGMTTATLRHTILREAVDIAHTAAHILRSMARLAAHIFSELTMSAVTIAQTAIRAAATIASYIKQDIKSAAHAAATVYAQVIDALPFPANVIVAPIAAAGTFAAVMAWASVGGSAAKGALLDEDMPIFAHAQEMILPAHLSMGLQKMIASNNINAGGVPSFGGGAGGGGAINQHEININMGDIHAIDSIGVGEQLMRARKDVGRVVDRLIRTGHLAKVGGA